MSEHRWKDMETGKTFKDASKQKDASLAEAAALTGRRSHHNQDNGENWAALQQEGGICLLREVNSDTFY